MIVKTKKNHPDAQLPAYATTGSACFDLFALEGDNLPAGGAIVIRTGLSFEIPPGHAMFIFSRSGHGFKHSVRLANCVGVIDSDYRGEVMVKLTHDDAFGEDVTISRGDRIAQAMISPVSTIAFVEAEALDETERGEGGFGSTGK